MAFWIGILVSILFAYVAIRMRFYTTWASLFNIVISVYLAIALGPALADLVSASPEAPYHGALSVLGTAIGAFLILHGISYTLITGQFSVPFPNIIDKLVAGVLGFLTGFLVWSFVGLLVCIMPASQNTFVKDIDLCSQFQRTGTPVICSCCDLVNSLVSSEDSRFSTEQAINDLLRRAQKSRRPNRPKRIRPSQPPEPNNVRINSFLEKQFNEPVPL
jgi:hypothetical protein